MSSFKKTALAASLSLLAFGAQAGIVDSFLETLPGGASPYPDAGFVGNQLNGMHDIIERGRTGLLVPLYTNHPSWDYDNRYEENAYPFGAGLSRGIIDERGNERLVYVMFFRDSHYEIEPIMGYAWLARYPLANTGFHLGAGYTAGVTFRQDYNWLPIPVPSPFLSTPLEVHDTSYFAASERILSLSYKLIPSCIFPFISSHSSHFRTFVLFSILAHTFGFFNCFKKKSHYKTATGFIR